MILLVAGWIVGEIAFGPLLVQHAHHRHRSSSIGLLVPLIVIFASGGLIVWMRRCFRR
jgi:hypothetical protein